MPEPSAAQDRWPDGSADECPKCGFLHAYDRSCEDRASSAASVCEFCGREVHTRLCDCNPIKSAASTDGKRLFSVSLSMTVEADSMEEADELLAEALDAPWFGGGGWTTTEVDPNA